ncbi:MULTISPECIES: hypothetical protein [unclassified Curtobacterium]|uniref:hypothetical protein n=1 Tax=unclassified Curtobacterium TaxID=257496 RepID=UPI0011B5C56E|nr:MULTISPECIES: hypothetical protein [unclassified Curtobacterium]
MTPGEAFITEFKPWVKWAYPTTGKVPQGALLDPFASSLRNTKVMVERLEEIATQGVVGGNDPTQAIGDIRATQLATGSSTAAAITPFGAEVRKQWRDLGVAAADAEHEIARCGVLLRVGIEHGIGQYVDMFAAWTRRTALQSAAYWLQDRWHLFTSSYLDKTSDSGYNAFKVITVLNDGKIGTEAEWQQLADSDDELAPHLGVLISRVASQRSNQRANFCKAMELYRLAASSDDAVPQQIVAWRRP